MRTLSRLGLALAPAALFLAAPAHAQVYTNDFESGVLGAEWSGAGSLQTTGGLSAFGFGQSHLKNDGAAASVLSLGGLAAHTSMTLAFDLAMWDSIDFGSDIFQLFVDGTALYDGTFGNYGQQGLECAGPGAQISEPLTDFVTPNYGHGFHHDCARAVTFTFAHSAPTAVFSFAYPNTQGASDEAFGVDNVVVRTDAVPPGSTVPEPGTYVLLATGLAGLALARRRRA
jgi:hypothetical protein